MRVDARTFQANLTDMRLPGPVRTTVLFTRRHLALLRIRRIPTPRDEAAARILGAVERTLRGDLEPEERAWVRRIEGLRRELSRSREPVTLTDFGARQDEARASAVSLHTVGGRCLSSKSPIGALLLFRLVRELRP